MTAEENLDEFLEQLHLELKEIAELEVNEISSKNVRKNKKKIAYYMSFSIV